MIKSWRHKGLKQFYEAGNASRIQRKHASMIHDILQALDFAAASEQMRFPVLNWHKLRGNLKGHYAVSVSENWRITFSIEGKNAVLVDYIDYR